MEPVPIGESRIGNEFGNITSVLKNNDFLDFAFAGGLYDAETGLTRFGARDYDPEIGRWTAKDPIGFGGGQSNFYEYCWNEPINAVDLSGLQSTQVQGGFGGTLAAFGGIHAEVNVGISVDWSDLLNSKFYLNGSVSLMAGMGAGANGGSQYSIGYSKSQMESGASGNMILHGEADLGAGATIGASTDVSLNLEPCNASFSGASGAVSGKIGGGYIAYVGAGVGITGNVSSPSIRDMWNWYTSLNANFNSWRR